DQRDLPGNGDAVELLPAAPADVDEATFDTVWPRLRNPTEGCALEAVTALELDERIEQTPRIDGHGLLDDVRQSGTPELISDEGGRLPFFGSPGDTKPERMRAERLELRHDVMQVFAGNVEVHAAPSSKPSNTSRTSGPSAARS